MKILKLHFTRRENMYKKRKVPIDNQNEVFDSAKNIQDNGNLREDYFLFSC
jgi:hypothetical protein